MHWNGKRKKPWKMIRWEEFVTPLVGVLFSMSYLYQVWGQPRIVVLWPYTVMALLLLSIVWVVVNGLAGRWRLENEKDTDGKGASAWTRIWAKPLIIAGTTITYLAAIAHLGFTLSNFLYLSVLFWALGSRRVWEIAGLSLLLTFILHLVMINIFQMPIPRLSLPFTSWEL